MLAGAVFAGAARARAEPALAPPVTSAGLSRVTIRGASAPVGGRCEVMALVEGVQVPWLLRIPPEICPRASGARLWVRAGDLSPLQGAPWPGASPVAPAREGAAWTAELPHAWPAGGSESGYWRAVAELRHSGVAAGQGRPALGFVVASVLGQPAALAPEQRTQLRRAGLGHVVAVSGMNVAIAAALAQGPLLRIGLLVGGGLWAAALLAWAPVLAYLGVTGWEPPALRAALMFAIGQAAVLAGRPAHGMTSLAIAAALLLAWRPAWASDPGLHLSLAAMAVLVHPAAPRGLLAQSWRVSWGTLPIVLVHFGSASLIGVVANVIAVPVFTLWVLPLGVIGLAAMPWCGPEALQPAALGGQVILDVAALAARAPEPPLALVAGLALLGLGVRVGGGVWLSRRASLASWIPGAPTCAATVAAALWVGGGSGPQEEPRAWVALGGPRSPAIVCPASSDASLACVRDPGLAPEAWPGLLRALGFRGAAVVAAPRSPPAAAAVRAELERAGMLAEGTCPVGPSLKAVSRALAGCGAQVGAERTAARAGPAGPECWTGAGWTTLTAGTGPEG